jgi:hypothetical protein
MTFTIGSSRVTFSFSYFWRSASAQYQNTRVDLEKAITDIKPVKSTTKSDLTAWTVREVHDTEDPDIMLLSSWKKALIPPLGVTIPLPMIFALWFSVAQIRIIWLHADRWLKDWTACVWLPMVVLDLFQGRES